MSVASYIKEVRGRSEAERKRATFMWTVVLVTIIFFVWAIYFSFTIYLNRVNDEALRVEAEREAAKVAAEAAVTAQASNTPVSVSAKGLLPTIGGMLSDGVDSVANGFWVIGDMIHK